MGAIRLQNRTIGSPGGVHVDIRWNPKFRRALEDMCGSNSRLQQYIDATILESIDAYVPHDTGMLSASARLHTVIGSGKIIWRGPQVRYLYHGMLMVDPITKKGAFHDPVSGKYWSRPGVKKILDPEKRELKFKGGGKRGAHWPERWKEDNLAAFQKALQEKVGELLR